MRTFLRHPHPRAAKDNAAGVLKAAYDAGYTDGVILLRPKGHDGVSFEPVERIRARYLRHISLEHPALKARAYIAGFSDAAADNLPCPPRAIGLRIAA